MKPITLEEMVVNFEKAVNARDYEEMDKWVEEENKKLENNLINK
jgi:hypothetical protein